MMAEQTFYILSDEDLEQVVTYSAAIFATYHPKQLADIFQVNPKQLGNPPTQQALEKLCYAMYERGHLKRIAVAAAKARTVSPEMIDHLCYLAATFLQAHYKDWAYHLYRRATQLGKKLWGEEHIEIVRLMNNASSVLFSMGKTQEAIQISLDALQMADNTSTGANQVKARTQYNLGNMFLRTEQLQEAHDHFLDAYAARIELFGVAHSDTINVVRSLGVLHYNVKNFEESLMYLEKAFLAQYYLSGLNARGTLRVLVDLIAVFDAAAAESNGPIFEERAQPYKQLMN